MVTPPDRAAARQVVDDAATAARALARLEHAAGARRLDTPTIAAVVGSIASGGHSLAGLLGRFVHDLRLDDDSPEAPLLRAAREHARMLVVSLRALEDAISGEDPPA